MFKIVLISICFSGFLMNIGVLIWKLCKRTWNYINTFHTINLTVTNLLTSLFLLVLSFSAISDMIHARDNNYTPRKQDTNLCKISTFIQSFAYEAKLGFLLIKCLDMVQAVNNTPSLKGLGVSKTLGLGVLVWFLSITMGVVHVVPINYFGYGEDWDSLERMSGELCSHVENLHNKNAGWEYSLGLHVGFNGLIYIGKNTRGRFCGSAYAVSANQSQWPDRIVAQKNNCQETTL